MSFFSVSSIALGACLLSHHFERRIVYGDENTALFIAQKKIRAQLEELNSKYAHIFEMAKSGTPLTLTRQEAQKSRQAVVIAQDLQKGYNENTRQMAITATKLFFLTKGVLVVTFFFVLFSFWGMAVASLPFEPYWIFTPITSLGSGNKDPRESSALFVFLISCSFYRQLIKYFDPIPSEKVPGVLEFIALANELQKMNQEGKNGAAATTAATIAAASS